MLIYYYNIGQFIVMRIY